MSFRVRMAPSPTGNYHLGHLRTVLYNYALARQSGGKFIIRIEDTDKEREVEGAIESILSDIRDYGLSWDEGPYIGGNYGPYIQSERLPIYKKYAQQLVDQGNAYYCFCSPDRLSALRREQQKNKQPPKYDKKCLALSPEEVEKCVASGESHVVRLNVNPDEQIHFEDLIYGELVFDSDTIDDQILIKSDGYPTYHMAVVVDDHAMEITHILRGNDWLPSAPKHTLLYKHFRWEMPKHAHLPNIKEVDGTKKLSKRFGSVYARQFLKEGYLPEAVLNLLMFLGWNPGGDKDIYSLDEFVSEFSLGKVHKTDLVSLDRKKLLWINGYYIRELSAESLLERFVVWANTYAPDFATAVFEKYDKSFVLKSFALIQDRLKKLDEVPGLLEYFFNSPKIDVKVLTKFAKGSGKEILTNFIDLYSSIESSKFSDIDYLDEQSHKLLEKYKYKPKQAFMTLRIALTGREATPSLFDLISLFGKDECLLRLQAALKKLH